MKTSVVLSSYNGELYIIEQLQSILNQSLQPDEVLIVDDGSKDATVDLVKGFIEDNGLDNYWTLRVNKENKGWKRNFMDAFHEASGDIIFSCDQDDIWVKDKIEKMVRCFENEPDMEVLTSNFTSFLDKDRRREYIKNRLTPKSVGVSFKMPLERVKVNEMVLHTFVPGCTMAFRPSVLRKADLIWTPDWAHDSIISNVAKLRGTYYFLNEPLILYRRHEGTSTPQNIKTDEGRIDFSKGYLKRVSIFEENAERLGIDDASVAILKKIGTFHKARISFFLHRSNLFRMFPYINYYKSFYSFAGDIYIRLMS